MTLAPELNSKGEGIMRLIAVALSAALITGCANTTPNPVSASQAGDNDLTCDGIQLEMNHIDQRVAQLAGEKSSKTASNVALGVAGWFLIVPWFFMDLSDSERVEMNAYKQRYTRLQQIQYKAEC